MAFLTIGKYYLAFHIRFGMEDQRKVAVSHTLCQSEQSHCMIGMSVAEDNGLYICRPYFQCIEIIQEMLRIKTCIEHDHPFSLPLPDMEQDGEAMLRDGQRTLKRVGAEASAFRNLRAGHQHVEAVIHNGRDLNFIYRLQRKCCAAHCSFSLCANNMYGKERPSLSSLSHC